MTLEDRELLLKDLSGRLPYGVKVLDNSHKNYGVSKLINIGIDGSMLIDNEANDTQYYPIIDETKPYLRPISSMTGEELDKYEELEWDGDFEHLSLPLLDWLNKKMFDYRDLIRKGLALAAPDGMYE